jgi:hypothetical protein
MSVPNLPVTLTLSTVTATKNGEIRFAEPYLLSVFFKVDGETVRIIQRADGKLALQGDPVIKRTDSRHGNLPQIRDGQTVNVPGKVGRASFELRPIPLPGALGSAVVGGASGVAGVLYVLNEQDKVPDDAIVEGYRALVAQFTTELRNLLRSVVIDPAAPGSNPFEISDAVKEAITERITAKVKAAVLSSANLLQKLGMLVDKDDILGTDVRIFTETGLLADPSQPFSQPFPAGSRGDWRVTGSATATVPADFLRRRRTTLDLVKLTCVTPNDTGVLAGDKPYMWNVFFTVDGSSVSIRNDLRLTGRAVVRSSPGSHGNLGASGVGAGDAIQIPDAVGRFEEVLDLIRFPPSLRDSLVGGISGVVGCVSVLLEQDLVADGPAEAGHQAFNTEVERILNELIPTLGVGKTSPSPEDVEAFNDRISERVREAILEEGNILQDLFAGVDPDDVIGFKVLLFSHKDLLASPGPSIVASYAVGGRYDLLGSVTAVAAGPFAG